jgi:tetratricopeptide (TPR) repeat protein
MPIEQKVECLAQAVGDVREQIQRFLAVTNASLPSGLFEARKIIEFLVGLVLMREKLDADRELLNNIEILGGKEGKFPARRRKEPSGPVPPPILPAPLYSSLHNLRIYGNLVTHPWDPDTMELKDVHLTSTDLQVALGQIMRLLEWYFQEYPRGPRLDPLYDRLPEPVVARFGEAPPNPDRFLGRTADLARLRKALDDGPARVVTLLASAGMGKTLLAARAALDAASAWQGGLLLWFDLKAIPSFGEVSARILASLQADARPADLAIVQLSPSARVGQIVRGLAERPVLLVLDNFESWLDPESRVPVDPGVALLLEQAATRAHRSRVLLTSRLAVELFGVPAEATATLPLGPMSVAEGRDLLLREGIAGTERGAGEVDRRLGGNPRLLIMLAEVLTRRRCRDLDVGLTRFPELASRAADGLLAEVWNELPEPARQVAQTLAILRPPTATSDLAGVLNELTPGAGRDVDDILWNHLVPRALVQPTDDGAAFAFEHQLIRDYALKQWPDPVVVHRAALRHYLAILAARGPETPFDPIHAAVMQHALAVGDPELAATTLNNETVKRSLQRQGRHIELLELCRPILAVIDRLEPLSRLRIRRLTGSCLDNIGDYRGALELMETCRAEFGEFRDTIDASWVLTELCSVLRKLQRYDEAEAAGQESLAICRRNACAEGEAWTLFELGSVERNRGQPSKSARYVRAGVELADRVGDPILQMTGRISLARTLTGGSSLSRPRALYEEALVLARGQGRVRAEAQLLQSLADISRRQTRNDEAMLEVNQSIDIFQKIGDRTGEGIAHHCRGLILAQMGSAHADEAMAEMRRSMRLAVDMDHTHEIASVLTGLATLLHAPETAAVAAACWNAADDLHTRMGHKAWKKAQRGLERLHAECVPDEAEWSELQRTVAEKRIELLEEASQIDAATWRRLLEPTKS